MLIPGWKYHVRVSNQCRPKANLPCRPPRSLRWTTDFKILLLLWFNCALVFLSRDVAFTIVTTSHDYKFVCSNLGLWNLHNAQGSRNWCQNHTILLPEVRLIYQASYQVLIRNRLLRTERPPSKSWVQPQKAAGPREEARILYVRGIQLPMGLHSLLDTDYGNELLQIKISILTSFYIKSHRMSKTWMLMVSSGQQLVHEIPLRHSFLPLRVPERLRLRWPTPRSDYCFCYVWY